MTGRRPRFWALSTDGRHLTSWRIVAYLASSSAASTLSPYRHSLLIHALSWLLIWCYCVFRCGLGRTGHSDGKRKAARAVGLLFVIAAICERVAGDQSAVSALQALLPCCTFAASYVVSEMYNNGSAWQKSPLFEGAVRRPWQTTNSLHLATLSMVAATSLTTTYMAQQAIVLGLTAVFAHAMALVLLTITGNPSGADHRRKPSEVNIDAAPAEVFLEKGLDVPEQLKLIKPLAFTAALVSLVACVALEPNPTLDGFSFRSSSFDPVPLVVALAPTAGTAVAPLLGALSTTLLILLVLDFGSMRASVVSISTNIFTQALAYAMPASIGRALLYTISSVLYWKSLECASSGSTNNTAQTRRSKLLSCVLLLLALCWLAVSSLAAQSFPISIGSVRWDSHETSSQSPVDRLHQAHLTSSDRHPVEVLTSEAAARFNETVSRQSQTLVDAAAEYRRRYKVHPPPNFDEWFAYAKRKGAVLVDEFDNIYDNLLPFWALTPFSLRQRVQQAFGYDVNGLMTLMIRNGEITLMDGSREWLREALREMTADFIEHVPDMDIAFNIHDEPRVTVPHSELTQMVQYAKSVAHPTVLANKAPRNVFSKKPADMTVGKDYKLTTITRFNKFSHQPTWSHARLSCPPDSPARDYLERAHDNLTAYAAGEAGFIFNYTAFTDICNSPSLSSTYGFFDRPNMFIPTQDLVPVFSQSKLSSFQDIVYPSPWYWADKVKYNEKEDVPWDRKEAKLYWRGSTTGGYSRYGGWRRHHRQRAVQHVNALDKAVILRNHNIDGDGVADWRTEKVQKTDYADSFDVHFSHIGQCDDGDCHAQKEFFKVAKKEDQQAAWKYRFLLDMDGNAFSGRFIAFLKSNSLVYKMALFREWHSDWLQPWVHYVPLSLRGDEWFATVKYLAGEKEGKVLAKRMAQQSKDWANKAMRKEDLQVWFFRLLLEYGRLLDDDREVIGYSGP